MTFLTELLPLQAYGIASAILLLLAALLLRLRKLRLSRRLREADPRKITLPDIDRMEDGSEFEQYLYRFVSGLGYGEVYKTTGSRDFGADLVFTDGEGRRCVVQAKRYAAGHKVSVGAVQEIYASMRYYEAERAIVLTSSRFTEACRILAGVNGVLLLEREDLSELIDCFKSRRFGEAMAILEEEADLRPERWKPGK